MTSQIREQVFNDGATQQRYYAEVPAGLLDEQSWLVEQIIQFALDTLGVYHLDVRVLGVQQESRRANEQSLTIGAPIAPGRQPA